MPWLQDFSLGRTYTLADVQAQIQAARLEHAHGFMLWNAEGLYTTRAALASRLHERYAGMQCDRPLRYRHGVATTRAIELRTAIPGPKLEGDPRAQGRASSPTRSRSTCRS